MKATDIQASVVAAVVYSATMRRNVVNSFIQIYVNPCVIILFVRKLEGEVHGNVVVSK